MIGYQDKINQILRGAETIKNSKDTKMNETDENGRLVKKWDVKDVEELKSLVEEIVNKYNELEFLKQLHVSELSLFVEDVKNLKEIINQKLIQRTELLTIAEEMAEVIIDNGASVKDAIPIDKLDEFYKKWNIGEPFVRDYSA